MAKRVFELAKELGVTSKIILKKCQAEGLDIKNHMSTVSVGLEMSIRDWFTEEDDAVDHTAVEQAEHVDLERARQEALEQRRRRKAAEQEEQAQKAAAEAEAAEGGPADESAGGQGEPSTAVAEAPATEASAAEATAETEAAEAAEPPPAAETPAAEAPAEPLEPVQAPAAETPAAEATAAAEAPEQAPAEEQQPAAEAEAPAEAAEAKPAAETAPGPTEADEQADPQDQQQADEVKPAGPQVVPRPAKLKGPRVVRVEKPEPVREPRPRPARPARPRGGAGGGPAPGPVPPSEATGGPRRGKSGTTTDREKDKKAKRRSPRRRGGRSGESGDRIREWRDADLAERTRRLAAASGGTHRRRRTNAGGGPGGGPGVRSGKVEIDEPITVGSLSEATGIKVNQIIRHLMQGGTLVTKNQVIDAATAESVCSEMGVELAVNVAKSAEDEMLETLDKIERGQAVTRAPVVTFLGHVDHGKTSLLDRIRNTTVADGEAGGITQHTGAYRVDRGNQHVVFLDTPGHEAFTAMRSRGANMTDMVVLVIAADDGVMPQTEEAISHAKAAAVPIVIALNKVDLPNANVQRVLGQLAERELTPQQWGGQTEVIETSAATGDGIDALLETLSLEAELLELEAYPEAPATGYVVESEVDPGRGAVARLLVRDGTLRVGDIIVAGKGYGRVRQMIDSAGKTIQQAGPATPVEVSGLNEIPEAGDKFYIVEDLDAARDVAEDRRQAAREKQLNRTPGRSLEDLLGQIESGEANTLPLIVKADVQGTVQALSESLKKIATAEAKLNILHAGVGAISTGDIALAEASEALIIGFNVVANPNARQQAEAHNVQIRLYRVIYDCLQDVRKMLEEGLTPEIREETLGRAEVRQTFKVSRIGTIAGCYVTDGVASRNAKVRITRDGIVIEDERSLDSLKRFKDDAREVRAGMECGLKVAGYDDIKEGDILEFYQHVEVARTL